MFLGRQKELKSLKKLYDDDGFAMSVIYGRRRIGKSTLISEFIKDKSAIFYTATKVGQKRNLELFSEQVVSFFEPTISGLKFASLESVLDYISTKLSDKKIILVIDELPYWAQQDEALLSVFQKYIDTSWKDKNIFIILCGSMLSFMEDKVLSEKSPLFGRRSSQMKIEAFDYLDASLFVPGYSPEDKALAYGVTGGVAKYLALLNPSISIHENIKNLFFHADGYLYDETRNLLMQEFSDVTVVNNIIEQIAYGNNTVNTISQKVGESIPAVLYSLDKLIQIGLVEKRACITEEKNRKKTQYVLKDSMFKFWYKFIPGAVSVIEMGQGDLYYERIVQGQLHDYMGGVFEEMCKHYTLRCGINGDFGNFITEVGTWWGTEKSTSGDSRTQQTADIDVVAISGADKTMVIGECKFKNEKIDKGIFETLLRRGAIFEGKHKVVKYLLFSLSGYTEWVENNAAENAVLLTLEDMYK